MALNWQQLVGPAQVDDAEAAQRRLALAQALQAKAIQGNAPRGGGRVVAKYSTGTALTDLANTLVANRNVDREERNRQRIDQRQSADLEKAIAAYSQSVNDEDVPQAAVQELRNTPDGQLMNPVMSRSEGVAGLAKASGPKGQAALAAALMEQGVASQDPLKRQDQALKAYQLTAGIEEKRAAREQRLIELQARMDDNRLNREQRAQAAAEMAALRRDIAADSNATRRDIADSAAQARKDAVTDKAAQTKADKEPVFRAAMNALSHVKVSSDKLGSGGGRLEGKVPAWGEATDQYEGAVGGLLAAIQSALRVPGIGSQSNMELQALMQSLPTREMSQVVRDQQIKQIKDRLEIIAGHELGGVEAPAGAAAPAAGATAAPTGGLTPQEAAELAELRKRFPPR